MKSLLRRFLSSSASLRPSFFHQSKLTNGLRVATLDTPGACISAGLRVTLPTNSLNPQSAATASKYILEKLALKATRNWNEAKIHAKLDELVGTVVCKSGRESLLYGGAVVPSQLAQLLEILKEISMAPLVKSDDLTEIKSVVEYELEELKNKPDELMPELAHGPAFYTGTAQGETTFKDYNSILGVENDLKNNNNLVDSVMEYWSKIFHHPANIHLLGTGMRHGDFHNTCQEIFGSSEEFSPTESKQISLSQLKYQGGSSILQNENIPFTHVLIAFEGAAANNDKMTFPLAILQMLMGGGNSFSAGGPGKGMYSRLFTQVLNRHHWVDSCKVFNLSYGSTGLFGIHGSAHPSNSRDLMEVMLDQLHCMTSKITPIELTRAKNQVKSAVLMGLESRMVELEDLGDQLAYCNERYQSPLDICNGIDGIEVGDLREVASKILSGKPTLVVYGPQSERSSTSPSYEHLLHLHQSRL